MRVPRLLRPVARDRIARLALAFVVAALAALVLVPMYLNREIRVLRSEVEDGAEAARTEVTRIQYNLARQMTALHGRLLSDDPSFVADYREAAGAERSSYVPLAPLARELGPAVEERLVRLRTASELWHKRVQTVELGGILPDTLPPELVLRTRPELYDQTLQAASDLDMALVRAARTRRDQIVAVESLGMLADTVLACLALASVLVVAWVGRRVNLLALEAERALEETHRTMESRNRLIRGISHDIKNPLGAADGYAQLLEMGVKGPLSSEQEQVVAGIRRSIGGALGIVGDLLDLARAETGALEVVRVPVELGAVVRGAVEDHRGAAETAGHRIEVRLEADPLRVETDAARVRQVLGNLLSNAVKYTPAPGCVTVWARLAGEDGARRAEVTVCDTGPGIPPEEREEVFAEFHRLHGGEVQGHGLGLAISRRVARLLGGDVAVGDAPGGGAAFTLWLPLDPPREPGRPATSDG